MIIEKKKKEINSFVRSVRWSEELSFRATLARNGPIGLKAQRLAACGLRFAACGLQLAAHSPRRPSYPEARWPHFPHFFFFSGKSKLMHRYSFQYNLFRSFPSLHVAK